jgi:hypothetical protein
MTSPDAGAQSGATGDGAQSGTGPDAGAGAATGTANADGTQSGTGQATYTPPSAEEWQRIQADLAKHRDRMVAADKRAGDFEGKYKQLIEKDLPEIDKLKGTVAELTEKQAKADAALRDQRIANAFLKDNTYNWHNADRALSLIDLSKVDIDAEGNVTGLKDALKALATSDPWLLKPKADGEGEGDGNSTNTGPPRTLPANNGGQGGGAPNRDALLKRFPAMKTRIS